jgi:phosphate/sulfate permease
VRWGVARQILWAWVLTIPAAFTIGAGAYTPLRLIGAN